MNFLYLLPFTYFFDTRLRHGSIAFHAVFEWFAAAVLVVAVGAGEPLPALAASALSYLAFISLYEVGYLVNDLVASRREEGGRRRGPQEAAAAWIALWTGSRVLAFVAVTAALGKLTSLGWWSFFLALALVLALHNGLLDRESKAATFLWLAWFRFMAPAMFVVREDQRLGIAFAAAMSYSAFRLLGYLDSKGLLTMSGRRRPEFRLAMLLMPLAGVLALWPYASARGFIVLSGYFAIAAVIGTVTNGVRPGSTSKLAE